MTSRRATIEVPATAEITPQAWNEIWSLSRTFYDTDRDYVEESLKQRQRLGLFRSAGDGRLVGMAAIDAYPVDFRGRRLAVIFTSHVLLEHAYRGHNLIQRLGLRSFLATKARYPLRPVYWFFDTFSYRSYLLLPRNFRDFWPRYDRPTPPWERSLMEQLAAQMYGADWRPEQGIVARSGRKRLRPETAPLEDAGAGNPHLEFYARANPGHAAGDMLVCLCPLSAANWLSVGLRALRR